ncbi:Hypp3199 [Branchiostoma lanceolatum]|uniref:Hypp3199 protein n=1 Tax=Branchiostoma lanceolatum TaxID=7740 RepID=A0A8J9ZXT3_BRALA|nr:Hypp3199 [Branchiostoma lanceolatum]
MWRVTVVLVGVFLLKVVAGEQCRALGGLTTFSCPRPIFDDNDDIYCCDGDCCDDCWESEDTSACTGHWGNIAGKALQLGIGAIIGIAVAVIVGVVIIIVACVCCCIYMTKQQSRPRAQGQQMVPVAQPAGQYPPPGGQYAPPAGQYPPPAYPPTAGPYPPLSDPAYPQDGGYVPTKI